MFSHFKIIIKISSYAFTVCLATLMKDPVLLRKNIKTLKLKKHFCLNVVLK